MYEPPKSAVSIGSGAAGVVALVILLSLSHALDWSKSVTIFALLGGCALVSSLWDVFVDKVHLRPSTGMDWSNPRKWSEIRGVVGIKLVGFVATIGLIIFAYQMLYTYQHVRFAFYFAIVGVALPVMLLISPVYLLWTTRYMVDPKDKLWHFGSFVMGRRADVDIEKVKDHLLCWTVKAFFLAFLFSVIPNGLGSVIEWSFEQTFSGIVPFFVAAIAFFFCLDIVFGTLGYVMTFRPLDSHIRTANPYLSAWVFALICYPPFILMSGSGPLNYRIDGGGWKYWLADLPPLLIVWGIVMMVLTALYAWATVIFGIRFSNLTNRGIITVGPYRYFKHPAYLSKNLYWWFAAMPFLAQSSDPMTGVRNSILLLIVNFVYFMRAKTEEKHLMQDPDYRAYAAWIDENGVLPRLRRKIGFGPTVSPAE